MLSSIRNIFKDKSKMDRNELAKIGIHVARDGSRHKIKDIDDTYLLNLFKFYKKVTGKIYKHNINEIASGYAMLGTMNGDMAIFSIETELERLEEHMLDPSDIFLEMPIVRFIMIEIEKRGLNDQL